MLAAADRGQWVAELQSEAEEGREIHVARRFQCSQILVPYF
jgi:hypothetical protein